MAPTPTPTPRKVFLLHELVARLEALVAKNPADGELRYHLERTRNSGADSVGTGLCRRLNIEKLVGFRDLPGGLEEPERRPFPGAGRDGIETKEG